uniref:Uncharacterized protein n=1 Tax=Tetranychus urticae TaxID=32264 RepID=T1L181_TETUR
MRFTIVLALCFIGAASASSLNKRSLVNDIQNNTRNAFHAFEQFGQNINEKVQEAFKNLFNAFVNNKNQTTEAPVTVTKRSSNPFALFDDLGKGDLVAFAQDLLKLSDEAKQNSEESLKKIFAFFEQFKHAVTNAKHNAEEAIEKLFSLFEQNKLAKPRKLSKAFTIAKFSVDEALWKFLTLFEQCKPQSNELSTAFTVAKYSAEDAVWKLISLFGQLQDAVAKTSSSSRGKRALSPFALTEDIQSGDVGKFFADLKQAHLESASYGIGMAERQ